MIDATRRNAAGRNGMSPVRRLLAGTLACLTVAAHGAAESTALDSYLADVKTLRAHFSQVVTDSKGAVVQRGTGTFVIKRPGRFRWELTPANALAPQLMVADGKNLWFYDRDLDQVSVKPASAALSATPASLLSGDGKLEQFFSVSADGKRDGLIWVRVLPKRNDADFREARLAFKGYGGELKQMLLQDKLGQTVQLDFNSSERNVPVADSEVTFTPPAGTDVIGTPAP